MSTIRLEVGGEAGSTCWRGTSAAAVAVAMASTSLRQDVDQLEVQGAIGLEVLVDEGSVTPAASAMSSMVVAVRRLGEEGERHVEQLATLGHPR